MLKSAIAFLFLINALYIIPCIGYQKMAHQLSYKIEPPLVAHFNCLKVIGSLKGNASGVYKIHLPPGLDNLHFRNQSRNVKLVSTNEARVYNLIHEPAQEVDFSYNVCSDTPHRNTISPMIEKDFLTFVAEQVLLLPADERFDLASIKLDLSGYPDDLKALSSFNYEQRIFQLKTTIHEFSDSVFALGDFNVDKINIKGNDILVVTNGVWSYFEKSPSDYVADIIKAQRNFWGDYHFPHYVIFLVKQNKDYVVPQNISGRHWHNFSMVILPEENLRSLLLYAFSHESFHAWIGKKMQFKLPQGDLQWFVEGFNDYYGLYLSHESKAITFEDYIKIYNKYMQDYFLSPIKNVSNQTISERYQFYGAFSQIAQIRSHFLANQLRKASERNGQNRFDEAMRALFLRYQGEKWTHLTEAQIDAVFKTHLGIKVWEEFKKSIESGQDISFSPTVFLPQAKLVEVPLDCPEFGFNLTDLYLKNVISQVDKLSYAYEAGLRDGQRVKYFDIDPGIKEKVATLCVEENGAEKILKFKPKVVKKIIPQYVMVKGDFAEKKLRKRV